MPFQKNSGVTKGENHTLFLDRDGVINVQLIGDYVKNVSELTFRDDFLQSAPRLQSFFQRIIVVTNQQGIAKGICTLEAVEEVHRYMVRHLSEIGIHLDKVYFCPHLDGAGCQCRKPEIGMALQAKEDFPDIDFSRSVMIGDSYTDMLFGKRSGMKTVFIGTPPQESLQKIGTVSDLIVPTILEYTQQL